MQFNWERNKQLLLSLFRYGLVAISALLVRHGVVDQATADAWVDETAFIFLGVVLFLVPVIWRYFDIKFGLKTWILALLKDPPTNPTPSNVEHALTQVKATAAVTPVAELPTK